MPKKNYDKLLSTLENLSVELYLSYKDIGFNVALKYTSKSSRWYELASYITIDENNGNLSKVYLHLNDFVTIQEEEYKESYAIIKGIFRYKGNDENEESEPSEESPFPVQWNLTVRDRRMFQSENQQNNCPEGPSFPQENAEKKQYGNKCF